MENHYVEITNKERITVTSVIDVDAFDENVLWANLEEGGLELTGANLHIEKLDLEEKVLVVSGQLESLTYIGKKTKNKKSLIERLVRR